MNRKLFILCIASLFSGMTMVAQTGATDTLLYEVVEEMPYPQMRACQPELHPEWPADSLRKCAESALLSLLAKNIQYPQEARENNIQGSVVVSFIVETDGKMSQYKLLRDIGGGCGAEALRVLQALQEVGLRWKPAKTGGKSVRFRYAMPLRFKLTEALPYYINELGDSVYTELERSPEYKFGLDSLINFVFKRLEYPAKYKDSCRTGIIEMSLYVRPDGTASVLNQLDFNNLGADFQWEALRLVNRLNGQWMPALYRGRKVGTTMPLRVMFKSNAGSCEARNQQFDQAMILADEGAVLSENSKYEEAIQKWTQALTFLPNNTEILYYRGTAFLNINKRDEACADWNQIKTLLGVTWFEGVRRAVCGL
ncbi:MAG: TonB family protein [Saprospiraceae bacterium]|nr:TonB family protein [Saprospiraceae bacterium]